MNRKGTQLQDLLVVGVGLFAVAVTVILVYVFLTNFQSTWNGVGEIPQVAKDIINDGVPRYLKVLDNTFLFLLVGSAIALFFGAAMLRANPVFFLIGSLILAVIVLVSMFLQDTYNAIVDSAPLAVAAANFKVIPFIFSNLPVLITVTGFLILIGLFFKVRAEPI